MQVLELKGLRSLRVINVFNTLMLGLKMLPSYQGEHYEEFLGRIENMPPDDQEKMIRESILFVELDKGEVEAALSFTTDANGIPISAENIKNLGPKDIMERVVAVCMKIAEIKIDLIGDREKKKFQNSQSI